jgi:hypothetical protein
MLRPNARLYIAFGKIFHRCVLELGGLPKWGTTSGNPSVAIWKSCFGLGGGPASTFMCTTQRSERPMSQHASRQSHNTTPIWFGVVLCSYCRDHCGGTFPRRPVSCSFRGA